MHSLFAFVYRSHFAAVIEKGQRFVILAFKDHRSAVGSVEEILQVVTGLIKTNSQLRESKNLLPYHNNVLI